MPLLVIVVQFVLSDVGCAHQADLLRARDFFAATTHMIEIASAGKGILCMYELYYWTLRSYVLQLS